MKKNLLITALLTLAACATNAGAIGTAAGDTVSNVGQFEYADVDNTTKTIDTTPVNITIAQVYTPNVGPNGTTAAPGQTVPGAPGTTATLTYTLTNDGNGTDNFNLAVTDATTGQPVTATIYLDNGDGVYGPGDTAVTSVANLPADQSVTLFVRYDVPASASGTASTYLNLSATSAGNTSATDTNNVGQISNVDVIRFTLEADRTVATQPNVAVTTTHTLSNTGNVDLIAADLRASATLGGTTAASGTVSYTVRNNSTGNSVSNASLQTALQTAGNLPAGQTYTITVTYTPASTAQNNESYTNTFSVYSATPDTDDYTDNATSSAAPVSDTDTVNIMRGVASVSKTVDNCGTSATCSDPLQLVVNSTSAKPGDYLRYTVTVTNTGLGDLKFPTLRDYVPAKTNFFSVTGTTTQSGAAVLFSGDRSTWNAAAPTALATATFTGSVNNGPFVFVGLDTDSNGTVNTSDLLTGGSVLRLIITVKVQ